MFPDRHYYRDNAALDQSATTEDWVKAAGLDFEVKRGSAIYTAIDQRGQEIEGCNADMDVLYRSDNLRPLSVVSGKYKVVQPKIVVDFFRKLVEDSGYQIETAGTFGDGRRLWAMCNTNLTSEIVKNDPVGGYVLLATSYDGSMSTVAKFTTIRVVCQNTLTAALKAKGKAGLHISVPHSSTFNTESVQGSLAGAALQFEEFKEIGAALARKQLTAEKVDQFLIELVARTAPEDTKPEVVRLGRTYKSIHDLFNGAAIGSEIPGVSGTAWGLLNACTEHYDWAVQARSDESRHNSAWFGTGERAKTKALQMLVATL